MDRVDGAESMEGSVFATCMIVLAGSAGGFNRFVSGVVHVTPGGRWAGGAQPVYYRALCGVCAWCGMHMRSVSV